MKKFLKNLFACFIILVLFGGFVFFLGWTQFKVPVNGFGIIVSKTGGVSKEPVKSGVFSWHWEFLIPTNAAIKTFKPEIYTYNKKITGQLSSGEFYSELNKVRADFSYSFDFKIVCKVEPENIIKLFSDSRISDEESLNVFINNSCDEVCQMVVSEYFKKIETGDKVLPEMMSSQDYLKLVDVENNFPYISFQNFSVSNVKLPDYKLYEKLRNKSLSSMSSFKEDYDVSDADETDLEEEVVQEENPVSEQTNQSEEDIKFLNKLRALLSSSN